MKAQPPVHDATDAELQPSQVRRGERAAQAVGDPGK